VYCGGGKKEREESVINPCECVSCPFPRNANTVLSFLPLPRFSPLSILVYIAAIASNHVACLGLSLDTLYISTGERRALSR
jgi:hypothetical protein